MAVVNIWPVSEGWSSPRCKYCRGSKYNRIHKGFVGYAIVLSEIQELTTSFRSLSRMWNGQPGPPPGYPHGGYASPPGAPGGIGSVLVNNFQPVTDHAT